MQKFEPLLNRKWTRGSITNSICGYWGEDEHSYEVTAPPQLTDAIISMQNYVYDLYKEITDREKSIARQIKELDDYKAARGYRE